MTPRRRPALGGLLIITGVFVVAAGLVIVVFASVTNLSFGSIAERRSPSDLAQSSGSDNVAGVRAEAPPVEGIDPGVNSASGVEESDSSTPQQAPVPIAIRIPAIDVAADMIPLDLRVDGSIEVPSDFAQTGWWADGPEPGEPGPAVVLGHVDSRSGPAVFFSLEQLQPGDEVIVDRVDGTSVDYRVDRIEQHPKDLFPTEAVYGDTPDAQLRLVTCGGEFDSSVRSYRDNVVVFASRV